jgi:hypothetical protein
MTSTATKGSADLKKPPISAFFALSSRRDRAKSSVEMARHRTSRRRSSSARYLALVPTAALVALGVAACGVDGGDQPLPIFEGGANFVVSSEGGEASTDEAGQPNEASTTSDGAPIDASTPDGSSTHDGGTSSETSLVISQVQSRGTGGANDEFIEIYNPTGATILFDATWTITVRNAIGGSAGCAAELPAVVSTGANQAIASHKHLLLTGSAYSEAAAAASDAAFATGISDAASVVLLHAAAAADALCFSYDATTATTLTSCATAYTCEGTPATNPHDNTTGTNTDASLERKPGGTGGNGTDTNVSSADFASNAAADPHDLASAAVP